VLERGSAVRNIGVRQVASACDNHLFGKIWSGQQLSRALGCTMKLADIPLCLFGMHTPRRTKVKWDGLHFVGACRHCGIRCAARIMAAG
jgi:hypothetical protein